MPADYPIQNFHFQVEWGGARIGFSKVRNLGMGTHYIEYRQGSDPEYSPIKVPGRQYFDNIILERGVFQGDNEFYDWWKTTRLFQEGNSRGSVYRRDITIAILGETHEPVVVFKVKNAFPVRLQISDLDAQANEIVIETVEIAHEGLVIQND